MTRRTARVVSLTTICLLVLCASAAPQPAHYVASQGDDAGPGTREEPFRTVQRALEPVAELGGTISIGPGIFDLEGLSIALERPTTIEGAGRARTKLRNPATITFTSSLTVRDLTFTGGRGITLKPFALEGGRLDGVLIERCVFQDSQTGDRGVIGTSKDAKGTITNFAVRDCKFARVNAGIVFMRGLISHVRVVDNTFTAITSESEGASAVIIGSNATMETTRDVLIRGNVMETITGPTEVVDGAGHEVHGVLAYGTNISIIGNTIRDLNAGRDHEAIYTKARHSVIAGNTVERCGSGGGGADIANKGGEFSVGNVIQGNTVVSDLPGTGIFIAGGCVVMGNRVQKTNGANGIDVYPLGHTAVVADNTSETRHGAAIYVNGGDHTGRPFDWPDEGQVIVAGNVATSHEGHPVKVTNALRPVVSGNDIRDAGD
ncbi:MAG TPA: right-handed parallel beta-helix repeat-containing protein [Armatimonadota bacterium]|nr:right-handed parallel beta-helix repeat-containing protein [Armatimonadota bacterium]